MFLLVNRYNKIIYCDNGTYSDHTESMRKWDSDYMVCPLTLNEDFIYIGLPHTFASRFFKVQVPNDVTAKLTLQYYKRNNTWENFKNINDMTASGGVPFSKSGFIAWDLPSDWIKSQINSVPDLEPNENTGDDHGYYWARIKSNVTLKATTSLDWLGLIWTSQDYMKVYWNECDSSAYLPAGKTHWYELIEMSTGDVADDLNIMNIIDYEMQIKDIDELAKATALKTLINILRPMRSSESLQRMKSDFELMYSNIMSKRIKKIDSNKDEKLNEQEQKPLTNSRIVRG